MQLIFTKFSLAFILVLWDKDLVIRRQAVNLPLMANIHSIKETNSIT